MNFRFATVAAALLVSASSVAALAQMPSDNDTWKARCSVLAAQAADLSHITPSVEALTRGVAGSKFQTFGFDREAAGQHQVACTMFYLAAIANQAGHDASAAKDAQLLANLEIKTTHGQPPSFSEGITRTKVKAIEITHPALTLSDEEKIVSAATTIPFTSASASVKSVALTNGGSPRLKH